MPAGLSLACQVLLLRERGLSLAAVAALFAVHSCTVAALELPTGGLSDVLGRRPVLVAAGLLNLTALLLVALGGTLWALVPAMLAMGAGRALSSGPAEAWYVDTAHALDGPGAELRTGLARATTASATALALGTLVGGGLPWLLSGPAAGVGDALGAATGDRVLPLSVPALLGAAVAVGFIGYVLTALAEPPRPRVTAREVLRGVGPTMLAGLRLGGRDALVRRLFLTAAACGGGLAVVELLTPPRAAALTGSPASGALLFAGLACAGFLCTALGGRCAPLVARLAGSGERAVLLSLAVSAAGLAVLTVTPLWSGAPALVLAAAGYGAFYLGLGSAGPSENELLHRRVDSAGRATALSVQSLALQAAGAAAGVVAGALPPGPWAWLPGAAALLLGALLWIRRAAPLPGGGVPAAGPAVSGPASVPASGPVTAPAGNPVPPPAGAPRPGPPGGEGGGPVTVPESARPPVG
nr:MFS transporter [Streptomyces zingiberis]